ncbi:hypothetical protein ACHAXH_004150 [Discostella pseudostelligera]
MIPRVLTSRTVITNVGRFESLIPVGVHSKLGKVTKPKSFKITGAGQPFIFEIAVSNAEKYQLRVDTSLRK